MADVKSEGKEEGDTPWLPLLLVECSLFRDSEWKGALSNAIVHKKIVSGAH